MNIQIHRKQMIILVLAIALAAASYWIPLPQQSEPSSSPSLILHESTPSSAPSAKSIGYAHESATTWQFPVTIQAPQTPVWTTSTPPAEGMQPAQALPTMPRSMDWRDFVNGEDNILLMPVKELNYKLKR
jgi:hypothetical protein